MVWLRGVEGLEMGAPWGGGRPAWAHSPPFTSSLPPPPPSSPSLARLPELPKRQKRDKGKLGWEENFFQM